MGKFILRRVQLDKRKEKENRGNSSESVFITVVNGSMN